MEPAGRKKPAWSLVLVLVASCSSPHERAELLALQGTHSLGEGDTKGAIALFDQSLQLQDREDAFLGRAKALAKTGDELQAVESLARCQSEACGKQRTDLLDHVKRQSFQSLGDDAGLKRFFRIAELAGDSKTCALSSAAAATSQETTPGHKLVQAALQTEVDRLAGLLHGTGPQAPKLTAAKSQGLELARVTDCDEIAAAANRTKEELGEGVENAFNWGVLSAKLALFTHSPLPQPPPDPLAAMPLRSGADLTAYLNASTAAGKTPACALFTAILRAEQLPRPQRTALKAPLMAALAPLAPKNGEKVEFKAGGRKSISMPAVASGSQSCQELDDMFAELSRGAAKMAEAMAAIGDDGSSGENAVSLDRTAYMYGALRTRLEHPMSRADRQAADDDYAQYRRTHPHARGD
jgi:hypothetical protein